MTTVLAYITTPNREEALRIGRALVENRLAACINVLDGMQSIYRWEGRVEEGKECVLLVKTRQDQADHVISKVKEMHSYSCPCMVFWPLTTGNQDYLDWIEKESGPSGIK